MAPGFGRGRFAVLPPTPHAARRSGTRSAAARRAPWNALNNTDGEAGFADALVLRDAAGVVVDALRYAAAWAGEKGRSLERLLPNPDVRGLSWAPCKAPGRATPGRTNSVGAPDRCPRAQA